MRFVHISDVHIGKCLDENCSGEKSASAGIFEALVEIVDYIETNPVDFLFITGDLFDRIPGVEEIRQVDMELARLQNVNIIYITGSSDYLDRESPLWQYKFVSRMYLMNGMNFNNFVSGEKRPKRTDYAGAIVDCIYFPEYNLDIYGICQFNRVNPRNEIEQVYPHRTDRKNILLAYGGISDFSPFDIAPVRAKNFDYVGLGRKHEFCKDEEAHLCYPGSLVPLSDSEEGKHGFIKGYIDGLIWDFKFHSIKGREHKTINLKVNNETGKDTLLPDGYKSRINDIAKLGEKNKNNMLGKSIVGLSGIKNPPGNELAGQYVTLILPRLADNCDNLIPIREFNKNQVKKAQMDTCEEIRRQINAIQKNTDEISMNIKLIESELAVHPERIGDINVARQEMRNVEYDYNLIKFKDDQVDKIYNLKKIGFITLILTPFVLLFLYRSSLDVLATYFKANWMVWYNKWTRNIMIIVIGIPLCNFIYNKTKKLRKKIFKSAIPEELHDEYGKKLKCMKKQLDIIDDRVKYYQEEQKLHAALLEKRECAIGELEKVQYKKQVMESILVTMKNIEKK